MGFISGMILRFRMSKAAVVVQNLLEPLEKNGLLEEPAALLANRLVQDSYDSAPDVLGGRFGKAPHKISFAAAALAHGIEEGADALRTNLLMIALGHIIKEVGVRGALYPFHDLDHRLLDGAARVFNDHAEIAKAEDHGQVNVFSIPDSRAGEVAERAAMLLETNLMLCRSHLNFSSILHSNSLRGYIVGFFDGAAQSANLKITTDTQFATFVGIGMTHLLKEDVSDPAKFALASLCLQEEADFQLGMKAGGSEYFRWIEDGTPAMGLSAYFHGSGRDSAAHGS